MKEVTKSIKLNEVDRDGDYISLDGLDIDNVSEVIYQDFDISRPVGILKSIEKQDNSIVCNIEISKEILEYCGLAPAYRLKETKTDGKVTYITKADLLEVSLVPPHRTTNNETK